MSEATSENQEIKEYVIPVTWIMAGHMKIKATSLEAAEELAHADPNQNLPEGHYIEDSLELDKESSFYGMTSEEYEKEVMQV